MGTDFLFGISLTASFLAGMLALFAPCCITFLLPSYLGTIFKERRHVIYYTLVFALGIAMVLMPIAVGARFIIFFLDAYHTPVYYVGAVIMILAGIMTLKPSFHLPQIFHMSHLPNKNVQTAGVFGLGLMSGLTSSCCAPVLFAAVTLTSLSPSLFQALIVSFAYVIGIVMPLLVISLFYEKANTLIKVDQNKLYKILKYIAAGIFFVTGVLIAIFNFLGKIQMDQMEPYGQKIRLIVFSISKYFQNPVVDITIFLLILFCFYKLLQYKNHRQP